MADLTAAFAAMSASTSSISPEEKLANFDQVPLFMKSLPSELGGTTEKRELRQGETDPSDTLAALQALAYEGDPSEIAEGFRTQGNDLFKKRKFRDAMGFYTRAIDEVGKELPIAERRTLYSNRAACNLELANYGACLRDCSVIFSQQPPEDPPSSATLKTNLKTLLRSARALIGLDKLPEALDALERLRAAEGEGGEDSGKKWRDEIEGKMRVKKEKELEKIERLRRTTETNEALQQALKLRGVIYPKPTLKTPLFHSCPTDVTPPHFSLDSLPPTSSPSIPFFPPSTPNTSLAPYIPWVSPPPSTPLIFPMFLLLPLASPPTRDLCLEFDERATFNDVLEYMEHPPLSLDLYFATKRGRVLKIGGKLTLGKVLEMASREKKEGQEKRDGWELKEGWSFEMVGVPKGREGEDWVKEWKEEVREGTKAIL